MGVPVWFPESAAVQLINRCSVWLCGRFTGGRRSACIAKVPVSSSFLDPGTFLFYKYSRDPASISLLLNRDRCFSWAEWGLSCGRGGVVWGRQGWVPVMGVMGTDLHLAGFRRICPDLKVGWKAWQGKCY